MEAISAKERTRTGSLGSNGACKVFALYEDTAARMATMQMCERLAGRFSDELVFEFSWLNLRRLSDAVTARRASENAAWADVVMFCSHGDDLSPDVVQWLDKWVATGKRKLKRAIALLYTKPLSAAASLGALRFRLERAATELGMDFLPLVPSSSDLELYNRHPPFIPSPGTEPPDNLHNRWGLNE